MFSKLRCVKGLQSSTMAILFQINGQVTALKRIVNYNNVGSKFLQVRIELYESCVIQFMLHGLEAWHYVTKTEYKNLEKNTSKGIVY